MHASLAYYLDVARPYLSADLVSPDALARLRPVAQSLPAWLTQSVLLECRLGDAPEVDLSVALTRPAAVRLLGVNGKPGVPVDWLREPRWQEICRLAADWDSDDRLPDVVTGICFEFDAPGRPDGAPAAPAHVRAAASSRSVPRPIVPAVFARIRNADRTRPDGRTSHARDVLAALKALAPNLPASTRTRVHQLAHQVPAYGGISWVASMMSRNDARARICIHGLAPGVIGAFLDVIGWTGSGVDTMKHLQPLDQPGVSVTLSIDIGDHVADRIGLEYRLPDASRPSASEQGHTPYAALIEPLEAYGLCTPTKAAAARDWHRAYRTHGLFADEAALILRCELIKVVAYPDGITSAKLYPSFRLADLVASNEKRDPTRPPASPTGPTTAVPSHQTRPDPDVS